MAEAKSAVLHLEQGSKDQKAMEEAVVRQEEVTEQKRKLADVKLQVAGVAKQKAGVEEQKVIVAQLPEGDAKEAGAEKAAEELSELESESREHEKEVDRAEKEVEQAVAEASSHPLLRDEEKWREAVTKANMKTVVSDEGTAGGGQKPEWKNVLPKLKAVSKMQSKAGEAAKKDAEEACWRCPCTNERVG